MASYLSQIAHPPRETGAGFLTFVSMCDILISMKIGDWLKQAKTRIDALDAELIAVYNFAPRGRDRSWLIAHLNDEPALKAKCDATDMVAERQKGVPLAYILKEKEFYGRKFTVSPAVLIPRPETESLIELVKGLKLSAKPKFLEIGTGSGCIAITLALEYPQSYVLATDISVRALDIAARNNRQHEGRVDLVQSNLLRDVEFDTMGGPAETEDLEDGDVREVREHFDVVVANLPYVNKEWDWLKPGDLEFEPANALYAKGNNGLSMYQRFIKELDYYDRQMFWDYLVLEADPCQHAALIEMARKRHMFHLKTEGYGLLFEGGWRYWYDYRLDGFVRKPDEVIAEEQKTGAFTYIPEEVVEE